MKLSYHHDGGIWSARQCDVESDNPERLYNRDLPAIHRNQMMFIRTILSVPGYGLWVRTLSWTFVTDQQVNGPNAHNEDPMWRCFRAMKCIERIDFQSMTAARERRTPCPQFASANTIRLGGPMSFALATSILHTVDPSKLTCLELDNLQDIGQLRKGKSLGGYENLSDLRETRYPNRSPKIRHPGPMRDHLRKLVGKCCALKSLTLRSVGNDCEFDTTWSELRDVARYEEWAAFIGSLRSSLRTFHYEQGKAPNDRFPYSAYRHDVGPGQSIRPMDQRFTTHIAPTLIKGPWPKLERVVIKGIGGSVRHSCANRCIDDALDRVNACQQQLQEALPQVTMLIFEKEASKTFYHVDMANHYNW